MGIRAYPPPRVVLDLYGHTTYYPSQVQDPLPPSAFEWPTDLPPIDHVLESVNSHDPARAIVHAPYLNLDEDELRTLWSFPSFVMSERVRMQLAIVKYYASSKSKNYHALRLNECPDGDSKSRQARVDDFSLVHQLERVKTYPATVILQGLGDTIVNPKMSIALEAQLRHKGVPVLALYEEGAPHGFDLIFEVSAQRWLMLHSIT
jgi:acetyl esterase/lipase